MRTSASFRRFSSAADSASATRIFRSCSSGRVTSLPPAPPAPRAELVDRLLSQRHSPVRDIRVLLARAQRVVESALCVHRPLALALVFLEVKSAEHADEAERPDERAERPEELFTGHSSPW